MIFGLSELLLYIVLVQDRDRLEICVTAFQLSVYGIPTLQYVDASSMLSRKDTLSQLDGATHFCSQAMPLGGLHWKETSESEMSG